MVLLGAAVGGVRVLDRDLRQDRPRRSRFRLRDVDKDSDHPASSFTGFVYYAGKWRELSSLSAKNWNFLTLSGLATGASWLCYFRALQMGEAAKVAPVDKLSVVLVAIFAVIFLGELAGT